MEEVKYPMPRQVLWWDYDGHYYRYGIAYRNEVICSCCGAIEEISDIEEFCPQSLIPILELGDWYDLEETDLTIMPKHELISEFYTVEQIQELAKDYDQFRFIVERLWF